MAMTVRKVTKIIATDGFDVHNGFGVYRRVAAGYTYEVNGRIQSTENLGTALGWATREAVKEGRASWVRITNVGRLAYGR